MSRRRAGRASAHPTGCHIHSRLIPSRRRRGARDEGGGAGPSPARGGTSSPRRSLGKGCFAAATCLCPDHRACVLPPGRPPSPRYSASFECGGSSRPSSPDRGPPSPAVPVRSCRWWQRDPCPARQHNLSCEFSTFPLCSISCLFPGIFPQRVRVGPTHTSRGCALPLQRKQRRASAASPASPR